MMIRYIDIGDQIMEDSSQFAWWNTVQDEFIKFNEDYVWDTWRDFEESFWAEVEFREGCSVDITIREPEGYLARFEQLYPLNLRRDNPLEKELVLEED